MLQSLCIYNPDLEPDEEHVADQIVFFYSNDPVNEDYQVRHIGLVQGVIEFSRGFSGDKPVKNMDTTKRRIVVTQIEHTNWWISVCVSRVVGSTTPNTDTPNISSGSEKIDPIYLEQYLTSPDVMISQLKAAYRRWKMHYGNLNDLYLENGRQYVVDLLEPWFNAWCSNWNPLLSNDGIIDLYADRTRMAKSHLTAETIEALASVLERERDKGLIDMLVTIHDSDQVEYEGCIFRGQERLSESSVSDLVRWITECHRCGKNEDSAFLESSGFTDHLNVDPDSSDAHSIHSVRTTPVLNPRASSLMSHVSSRSSTPDTTVNIDTNFEPNVEPSTGHTEVREGTTETTGDSGTDASTNADTDADVTPKKSSTFFSSAVSIPSMPSLNVNMTMNPMPALGSAFHSMANASYVAADRVKDLSVKSMSLFQAAEEPDIRNDLADSAPSDDLSESRFLIGLKGHLSDGPDDLLDYNDEDHPDTGGGSDLTITSKQLFIHLRDGPDPDGADSEEISVKCNVVVYQRPPFIFALFYQQQSPHLSDPQFYKTLHLRLASIAEPIYGDLSQYASTPITTPTFKFYYIVIDSAQNVLQTSLPGIPPLPVSSSGIGSDHQQPAQNLSHSALEKLYVERLELLHIHQSISKLISNLQDYEQEKFIRTSYNWWIYWSKIDIDRTVIFAKRWTRSSKASVESGGLLGAIGKDVKIWLDNYKIHGKV